MTRERDPLRIPLAGLEVVPLAALAATLCVRHKRPSLAGRELVAGSTLAGVISVGAYQALLSAMRSEVLCRRGELSRADQVRLIVSSVWAAMKEGTAVSLVISVVLLVFPWLALPLTLLGLVGIGQASLELFHAMWDGLSEGQKGQLHEAAYEAGLNLNRLLGGAAAEPDGRDLG